MKKKMVSDITDTIFYANMFDILSVKGVPNSLFFHMLFKIFYSKTELLTYKDGFYIFWEVISY